MSELLLDEYPLIVLPSLAVKVGLNEAIFLQQVNYWIQNVKRSKQQKNNNYQYHVRDGKVWVFNTISDWQKQFPFWSTKTTQRIIEKLEKKGYLIAGNYNTKQYDRTKWYTLNFDKIRGTGEEETPSNPHESSFSQNDQMDLDNLTKSFSQNDQMDLDNLTRPIPETTTETTTNNNTETTTTKPETVVVVPNFNLKRVKSGLAEIGINTIQDNTIDDLLAKYDVDKLEYYILNVAADIQGKKNTDNPVKNAASLFLAYIKNRWKSQFLADKENGKHNKENGKHDPIKYDTAIEITRDYETKKEAEAAEYQIQNPEFKKRLAKIKEREVQQRKFTQTQDWSKETSGW